MSTCWMHNCNESARSVRVRALCVKGSDLSTCSGHPAEARNVTFEACKRQKAMWRLRSPVAFTLICNSAAAEGSSSTVEIQAEICIAQPARTVGLSSRRNRMPSAGVSRVVQSRASLRSFGSLHNFVLLSSTRQVLRLGYCTSCCCWIFGGAVCGT